MNSNSPPTLDQLVASVLPGIVETIRAQNVARYVGERISDDAEENITTATPAEVRVERRDGSSLPLNPRFDVGNHSPDGFNWGYGGSGPAQLALAILADFTCSVWFAESHYQEFKSDIVARVQSSRFEVAAEAVLAWTGPRLAPFVTESLRPLFDEFGRPANTPFLQAAWWGPEFFVEWNADGSLDLLEFPDGPNPEPLRERIIDFAGFFAAEVFQAQPRPHSKTSR